MSLKKIWKLLSFRTNEGGLTFQRNRKEKIGRWKAARNAASTVETGSHQSFMIRKHNKLLIN